MNKLLSFYKGKKVFITGHTGFKGSWMCKVLAMAGAEVTGYSLQPPTSPSLYEIADINKTVRSSIVGDVRDLEKLKKEMLGVKPDIVFHLAAQPIVRESYINPVYTYETNVIGTVNVLEAIRSCSNVKSVINITTDKVYRNNEWDWGYRETDYLDGFDPYSNSKSCSELVTSSYKKSFFANQDIAISTCRAGNVIGGGDFAKDRIIPDCVRAMQEGENIIIRNPNSTRPYQHVLEPVYAYLLLAMLQYKNCSLAGNYNVGPDDSDCVTTGQLATLFCNAWGTNASWENVSEEQAPHEATVLKLDCSKIKHQLSWQPRWHIKEAVDATVEWSKAFLMGDDVVPVMEKQIRRFMKGDSLH